LSKGPYSTNKVIQLSGKVLASAGSLILALPDESLYNSQRPWLRSLNVSPFISLFYI
jgi:hypothetical protein